MTSDPSTPEARFKTAILDAPACICVLHGPDHVFQVANASYRELVGHRPLIGLPVRAAVPELAGQGLLEQLDRVYRTGETFRAEHSPTRLRDEAGNFHEMFFTFVYQPLLDASGKPEGILAFGYDVTEHVVARERAERLAAERDQLIQQLRQSVQARDEFIAISSHELKTPLTALQLSIHSLALALDRAGYGDAVVSDRFIKTRRNAERLQHLVDSLVEVSRIVTGHIVLSISEFDLVELVQQVVERFRKQAEGAGCELTFSPTAPIAGRWDRIRIEQVVGNVLANAVKYGRGEPIAVMMEQDDRGVRIVVVDRGMGIQPDALQRIFARFERGVSSRHFGGFGLGLFIARAFAEAHGGTINARSAPGAGSTFTIELPLARPSS